jgi:nicotinamidase-related amidase
MSSALLVIDMQNGFCSPEGSLPGLRGPLAGIDDCVRNAVLAVQRARAARIPVVFTRQIVRPGRADVGANLRRRNPGLARVNGLAEGGWDARVIDELECGGEDLVVDKVRFDAFQWTSLDLLLAGLGVDELVVLGVVTNLCVESTVRSAYMRDYRVTLLADCCASVSERMHDIAIEAMGGLGLAQIDTITGGFDFRQDAALVGG